jgi:hypothetical protein
MLFRTSALSKLSQRVAARGMGAGMGGGGHGNFPPAIPSPLRHPSRNLLLCKAGEKAKKLCFG